MNSYKIFLSTTRSEIHPDCSHALMGLVPRAEFALIADRSVGAPLVDWDKEGLELDSSQVLCAGERGDNEGACGTNEKSPDHAGMERLLVNVAAFFPERDRAPSIGERLVETNAQFISE